MKENIADVRRLAQNTHLIVADVRNIEFLVDFVSFLVVSEYGHLTKIQWH